MSVMFKIDFMYIYLSIHCPITAIPSVSAATQTLDGLPVFCHGYYKDRRTAVQAHIQAYRPFRVAGCANVHVMVGGSLSRFWPVKKRKELKLTKKRTVSVLCGTPVSKTLQTKR